MGDKLLKCSGCNNIFKESAMKSEKIPDNFHAVNTKSAETGEVDQCPYCDYLAFFGFREA